MVHEPANQPALDDVTIVDAKLRAAHLPPVLQAAHANQLATIEQPSILGDPEEPSALRAGPEAKQTERLPDLSQLLPQASQR